MWKIHNIIVCVTCTVFGVLVLPSFLVISVLLLIALLTGLVLYDLPLSVHVASIWFRITSYYNSVVDSFCCGSQTLFAQRRHLISNGIVNNHSIYQPCKSTSSNLISRNKLCKNQELPDSFTMPLSNCNLHSTPLGVPKSESSNKYNRKQYSDFKDETSWCDQKVESFSSKTNPIRNVQTIAGPLLASTKFNTSMNAELAADVSSLGFSSRVAQKANARDNVTHQAKYSGIGVFPIVQLNSHSPKHAFSPRNNSSASKSVKVRIAPPDTSPFGGLENCILAGGSVGDESMKSVLQVLKEMSRKRIHSQVDEDDDEKVKRQKKECCDENTPKTYLDGGLQNKRVRDASPRSSEEVKRQRRQMNMSTAGSNEILSSLSSSLSVKPPHLLKGTKRKAHAVDWSRSTTPVSGKLLKVNVSPPVQEDNSLKIPASSVDKSDIENISVEMKEYSTPNRSIDETRKSSSSAKNETDSTADSSTSGDANKSNDCVRIEAGQRRVLARCGDVREVQIQDTQWNDVITTVADTASPSSISLKKIKDPGRRLKDMLAAINGNDDIEADSSSMSPSVIAILKTAKSSSKQNKSDVNSVSTGSGDYSDKQVKSPVSILKTPGRNESHKTVTFSDRIETSARENQEKTNVIETTTSSPQTCLTTATIVSNSINTSISCASETSPLGYNSFSTYNSASSAKPASLTFSSSLTTSASTSATTTVSQQSFVQSPPAFTANVVSNINLSANASSDFLISSTPPQNIKPPLITTTESVNKINNSVFSNSSTKERSLNTPDPSQSSQRVSAETPTSTATFGVKFDGNAEAKLPSAVFGFSSSLPNTSTINSVSPASSGANMKPSLFSFNSTPASLTSNINAEHSVDSEKKSSEKHDVENSGKFKVGFSFGNPTSQSNDKPNLSFFGGLPNVQNPTSTTSSFSLSTPSVVSSSNNNNNVSTVASTMFSFHSNSNIATPTPTFVTTSQTPSIFAGATQSMTQSQTIFGNPAINNILVSKPGLTVAPVSNTSHQSNLSDAVTTSSMFLPVSTTTTTISSPAMFSSLQPAVSSSGSSIFGSNNLFSSVPANKPEGFSHSNAFQSTAAATSISSAPSLFSNFNTSSSTNRFGTVSSSTPNTFSSTAPVSSSASVFGGQVTTASSLFTFGSSTVTTQNSVFGTGLNSVTTPLSTVNGPSSFASFTNATGESDKMKQQSFGSSSFQTPNFSFGSSAPAPASTSFGFGSTTNSLATTTASSVFNSPFKPPEQKPFGFDSVQPAMQNSTQLFGFTQNNNTAQQPVAPAFQFHAATAAQQPALPGVFNFGAATNTSSPFGSGINPPAFSIGSGGSSPGSSMFNIGSGNSSARARTVGRPRRK